MTKAVMLLLSMLMLAAVVSAADTDQAESKEERLIGAIVTSTTTLQRLRTTTVTRPLTCLTGVPVTNVPCTGRRRRRHARLKDHQTELTQSDSALELEPSVGEAKSTETDRSGKLILFATRYVSSVTEFTTSYTSTDTDTTVSVSVLCSFANIGSVFRLC